ncbi:hypothetical protein GOA98_09080 [Sinorhizobium meliloti]|nr:hypothetical protein [Sinorhizobium meliloti]
MLFRIRTTDLRRAATKVSELQVVYVDANGNVEEVPLEMIGDRNLAANEVRTIPQPDTGNIRFDTPGRKETLVVLCHIAGASQFKLDKEMAARLLKKYKNNFKRGVAIELSKKVRSDPATNGFKFVTFNVSE